MERGFLSSHDDDDDDEVIIAPCDLFILLPFTLYIQRVPKQQLLTIQKCRNK